MSDITPFTAETLGKDGSVGLNRLPPRATGMGTVRRENPYSYRPIQASAINHLLTRIRTGIAAGSRSGSPGVSRRDAQLQSDAAGDAAYRQHDRSGLRG